MRACVAIPHWRDNSMECSWASMFGGLGGAIAAGIGVTLGLTLLSCGPGLLAGLAIALALVAPIKSVARTATVLVESLRAIPPLVLLIWLYYVPPTLTGVALGGASTATIAFGMVFSAFAADVFRGSIQAIPEAALDSGRALGMTRSLLLRRVVIPETARRSIPALNALIVSTLKMSSLASVIAVPEITYRMQLILADRPRPIEVYSMMAIAYVATVLPIVLLLRWAERQDWCSLNPTSPGERG